MADRRQLEALPQPKVVLLAGVDREAERFRELPQSFAPLGLVPPVARSDNRVALDTCCYDEAKDRLRSTTIAAARDRPDTTDVPRNVEELLGEVLAAEFAEQVREEFAVELDAVAPRELAPAHDE